MIMMIMIMMYIYTQIMYVCMDVDLYLPVGFLYICILIGCVLFIMCIPVPLPHCIHHPSTPIQTYQSSILFIYTINMRLNPLISFGFLGPDTDLSLI